MKKSIFYWLKIILTNPVNSFHLRISFSLFIFYKVNIQLSKIKIKFRKKKNASDVISLTVEFIPIYIKVRLEFSPFNISTIKHFIRVFLASFVQNIEFFRIKKMTEGKLNDIANKTNS